MTGRWVPTRYTATPASTVWMGCVPLTHRPRTREALPRRPVSASRQSPLVDLSESDSPIDSPETIPQSRPVPALTIWTMVAWRPVVAALVPSRDSGALTLRVGGLRSYPHPPLRQSVKIPALCQASTLTLPRGRATHIKIYPSALSVASSPSSESMCTSPWSNLVIQVPQRP